jgi:hypothetical protein
MTTRTMTVRYQATPAAIRAARHACPLHDPASQSWDPDWSFYLRDPNGNYRWFEDLELVTLSLKEAEDVEELDDDAIHACKGINVRELVRAYLGQHGYRAHFVADLV